MDNTEIISEIRKRPFVRPLIFWIFGILLYVCFPVQALSFVLPLIAASLVLLSFLFREHYSRKPVYFNRWLWGSAFACMTVFMAVQVTALNELTFNIPSPTEPFYMRLAKQIQSFMIEKIDTLNLPNGYKSVIASLTINYKTGMPTELKQQFSVSGVAHIIAVSGFHVGIIYGFVRVLLSFLHANDYTIRISKCLISIVIIWLYACVSGLSASSVRAALMITIYITGDLLQRKGDKYNTLAAACLLQLAYNPFWLFNIGFQFSYLAVFFILYLQPRFSSMLTIRNPIIKLPWEVLTVTLAAQTGVSFLSFYYFGFSSSVFLFTNIFLTVVANLLIPLTLLWLLFPVWMPYISELLKVAVEQLTRFMMFIIESFASLRGAKLSIPFDLFTTLAAYLFLMLLMLYFRRRRYALLFASLTVLLAILFLQLK